MHGRTPGNCQGMQCGADLTQKQRVVSQEGGPHVYAHTGVRESKKQEIKIKKAAGELFNKIRAGP